MEFFDALVSCAQLYVTEAVTKDPSSSPPMGSSAGIKSATFLGVHAGDQMSILSEATSARSVVSTKFSSKYRL